MENSAEKKQTENVIESSVHAKRKEKNKKERKMKRNSQEIKVQRTPC